MSERLSTQPFRATAASLALALAVGTAWAQTRVTAPPNKYPVKEDVKLGQEAASEARRQLPMLNDDGVDDYVEDVGRRLVAGIPPEFRHSEFRYTFDVVNMKEINAFALPGGPMFLNRGMIESARSEGEMAGVMAHELSHVALRHGTAQASAGTKAQVGSVVGQVLGAIVGGGLGTVISQGSQIGAGLYFNKYSREYERQADILGAQIMARSGYDPRAMASMFQTIEKQGGGGGPEWMSSHPNPGNRAAYITKEAQALRVQGTTADTGQFASVRSRLGGMSPALTAEQVARAQKTGQAPAGTSGRRTVRVSAPSGQYRNVRAGNFLRMSVPSNWEDVSGNNSVTFAPEGAVFDAGNGPAFTHGVQVGIARGGTGNLQRDTESLLQGFAQSNRQLRQREKFRRVNVDGRTGLTTTLQNVSEVTGEPEFIAFTTVQMQGGDLLYFLGVAPEHEAGTYNNAFNRVRQSMQLSN